MVLGITAALFVILKLTPYYHLEKSQIFDLSFWLIILGLVGSRLYDDLLNLPYYLNHPVDSLKIWQGGLAIHGAIVAGLIVIWIFSKKNKIGFWRLSALIVPGLALGQAIGRWGNYFNQEIFGQATNLPWGVPIDLANRPLSYINSPFFQPTFLYESLGCFLIFLILLSINLYRIKKTALNRQFFIWSTAGYVILYSILRFFLEFIRIDTTPDFWGWRLPQIISLLLVLASLFVLTLNSHASSTKKQ